MSFQGDVEIACPSCRESFEAPVWSFVHGGSDENLRDQAKARELNLLLCAHCGAAFVPEVAWIYYEPDAEILVFVFPDAWQAEEARWRGKMKEDYEQMRVVLGARLPVDMEPEVCFGQDGLARMLEAEDWRNDERDVVIFLAEEIGLSIYKASPLWARANAAPSALPYKGKGAPTRASLIAGLKALTAANDRLTAWSDFLARYEDDADAAFPPAAKAL
ncbi:MAG: CpXC domain-containing protein [Elusimicrobiota bacterium]